MDFPWVQKRQEGSCIWKNKFGLPQKARLRGEAGGSRAVNRLDRRGVKKTPPGGAGRGLRVSEAATTGGGWKACLDVERPLASGYKFFKG